MKDSNMQFLRMVITKYKHLLILLVLLFTNLSFADDKKPAWVKKRPVSAQYYLGIGVSQKKGVNRDYIQSAKNNALNDLASEITVTISGEFINIAVEQYGMLEEEV
ncbi:MAG: LPP20 family lipoprotein, partial [bacterium]